MDEKRFLNYYTFTISNINEFLFTIGYYILSIIGIVGIFFISMLINKIKYFRVFSKIGQCSMDIYVMHMFLIKFIPITKILNNIADMWIPVILCVYCGFIIAILYLLIKYLLVKIRIYRIAVGRDNKNYSVKHISGRV